MKRKAAYMEHEHAGNLRQTKQSALAKPSAPVVLVKQPRVNYDLTRNAASEICARQVAAANDILEGDPWVFSAQARGSEFQGALPFPSGKSRPS